MDAESINPGTPESANDRRAYLFLTTTSLCWAANAVFGRVAVGEVSPLALVTFRWIFVLTLLGVFAWRTIRKDLPLLRKNARLLGAMGALGFTVFNTLFYTAAHYTTAINLGILQGVMPVFVLVAAFLVFRTPTTPIQLAGVIVTLGGAMVVATAGSVERLLALALNRGDLLIMLACMLFAGYTVGLRRRPDVSAISMFAALAAGALITAIPLLAVEVALGQFQWPTVTGWILIFAAAVIPSITGQICFMQGVQIIGPKRAGVFVNLVPVFASVLAIVFLGEVFKSFHAVALALVFGGIWLSEQSGDRL